MTFTEKLDLIDSDIDYKDEAKKLKQLNARSEEVSELKFEILEASDE